MEWVKSITDKRMGAGKEEENKRRCGKVNKFEVKDNKFYLDGSELKFLTEITIDKLSDEKARVSLSMVVKITGEIELPTGLHWTLSARAPEPC